MTKEEFVKSLSAIIAGTQVPMSMGMLGTAKEPLVALRDEMHLFGWVNAEEIESKVTELLDSLK